MLTLPPILLPRSRVPVQLEGVCLHGLQHGHGAQPGVRQVGQRGGRAPRRGHGAALQRALEGAAELRCRTLRGFTLQLDWMID